MKNKTVWLLWLQGWDTAPWLIRQVAQSWELNNPDWTIRYLSWDNLRDYVTETDYIFDPEKNISPQALSDIIRLRPARRPRGRLGRRHPALHAAAQPMDRRGRKPCGRLDVPRPSGGMDGRFGPASWFIAAEPGALVMRRWKKACDDYWRAHRSAATYFWMDGLFKALFEQDEEFRQRWRRAPHLYVEGSTQAHSFARGNRMLSDSAAVKRMLAERPPYVLKLWWRPWEAAFPIPTIRRARDRTATMPWRCPGGASPTSTACTPAAPSRSKPRWRGGTALYFANRWARSAARRSLETLKAALSSRPEQRRNAPSP